MRNFILIYMICASTLSLFAQTNDTIQNTVTATKNQDILEVKVTEKSPEEKLADAQKTIEEQQKLLLGLRDVETKLGFAQNENVDLKKKLAATEKRAESVERSLIAMASNFLYVTYEAYGVEKIAIKAFESVQDERLKRKYKQRYVLLKNYQQHLRDFKTYLEKVQKECNGKFQATATEFINPIDPSVSPELILKQQSFYQAYVQYEGYQDTFIGGLIQKTESILKSHTKQNRANLQGVIKTIEKTQTLVQIDSVESVISTVDECLKTIEDL